MTSYPETADLIKRVTETKRKVLEAAIELEQLTTELRQRLAEESKDAEH